jgi:SpoVK/Ycf46/Vps4 family AAA+-type ATPase
VAKYRAPSVVFIDEVDSMLTIRKSDENEASTRIKTEFMTQMDGAGNESKAHVLMIGATNRPQELDDAIRRRFVKRLYVPLPEMKDREVLLRKLLSKNYHVITDKEFGRLAIKTDGFSGADIKELCTEAAMGPVRQLGSQVVHARAENLPPISYKHCRQAVRSTKPSVAPADLKVYLEWDENYGTKVLLEEYGNDTESDCESSNGGE